MINASKISRKICSAVLMLLSMYSYAYSVTITAAFDPAELLPGERGTYSLSIEGSNGTPAGSIPQPPGLQMQGPSQSSRTNIVNGSISQTRSLNWSVMSQTPGTYVMPSTQIQIDGNSYTVPEATLIVIDPATSPTAGMARGADFDLSLRLPRDEIYVGESVSINVDFKVAADVQYEVRSHVPLTETDDFIIDDFTPRNQQRPVSRFEGNRRMNTFSFPNVMTPLKSGDLSIQFNFPIRVVSGNQQNQRRRSMFDDPFFNSPLDRFFDRRQWREIDLNSNSNVKVLPLPKNGKPKGFTNAIGSFTAQLSEPATKNVEVGEPITLNFSISGEGNFSRINAPTLDGGDSWKIYDPKSNFEKVDQFGQKGGKHFEYILIPEKAGQTYTPPIEFSFFDPIKKQYEVMDLPTILINVRESANQQRAFVPANAQQSTQKKNDSEETEINYLIEIQRELGTIHASTAPLFTRGWFIAIQPLILAALGTAVFYRSRQLKLRSDPRYAKSIRYSKAAQKHMSAAKNNAKSDFAAFFEDAKNAIRTTVAKGSEQDAESLTLSDIKKMLSNKELSEEHSKAIDFFFNTGDALKYGGIAESELNEAEALQALEDLINYLNKIS